MLIATIYDNCKLKIQQRIYKAQSDIRADCRAHSVLMARMGASTVHTLPTLMCGSHHVADSLYH